MDRSEISSHPGEPDPSAPAGKDGSSPAPEVASADPEHDLIRRAQAGDEAAFETLVRRHQQRAYRIARHLVPNDEDARDLAQDAFLRIFRSLDRFDFQYGFHTWLNRIVTNLAIDHLRRRRAVAGSGNRDDDEGFEPSLPDPAAAAPSDRLESNETAREVRDCIAALAPHFQAVLTLRELEGLPCTEIARIVGATHVTVRWRLHRGRKLFQEEWERRERVRQGATPQKQEGAEPPARQGAEPPTRQGAEPPAQTPRSRPT